MASPARLAGQLCRRRASAQRIHCGRPQAKHLPLSPRRPGRVSRGARLCATRHAGRHSQLRPHPPQCPGRAASGQCHHVGGTSARAFQRLSHAHHRRPHNRLRAGPARNRTTRKIRQHRSLCQRPLARQPDHTPNRCRRKNNRPRMPAGRSVAGAMPASRHASARHSHHGAQKRPPAGHAASLGRVWYPQPNGAKAIAGRCARSARHRRAGRCPRLAPAHPFAGARAQVSPFWRNRCAIGATRTGRARPVFANRRCLQRRYCTKQRTPHAVADLVAATGRQINARICSRH